MLGFGYKTFGLCFTGKTRLNLLPNIRIGQGYKKPALSLKCFLLPIM